MAILTVSLCMHNVPLHMADTYRITEYVGVQWRLDHSILSTCFVVGVSRNCMSAFRSG